MNQITLSNDRPGLRSLLSVKVLTPTETQPHGNTEAPALDFLSSDATLDRYQEIIDPAGWKLDSYLRNPVFQNAHQYGDIIFTLGKALVTEVRSTSSQQSTTPSLHHSASPGSPFLFQRIQFATDANPMARIAYSLYKGGFLNAVSVGFIPIRWQDPDDPDPEAGRGGPAADRPPCRRRYLEQELLEVSAVAIPANPNALTLALKSGAVEKSDLRELADLLRAIAAASPSDFVLRPSAFFRPSDFGLRTSRLLSLARDLRSILRRA